MKKLEKIQPNLSRKIQEETSKWVSENIQLKETVVKLRKKIKDLAIFKIESIQLARAGNNSEVAPPKRVNFYTAH